MTNDELVKLIASDLENYKEMEAMLQDGYGSTTIAENTEYMRHYEKFGCGVVVCFLYATEDTLNPQIGIIHEDDECYCLNDLNFDQETTVGEEFITNAMSVFWLPSLMNAMARTINYLDSVMEKDGPWYIKFKENV